MLVQNRDRFAREPAYLYPLRKEFEEHGCKLRALNDLGDDSPEGELTDSILDQLATLGRVKLAERTSRGKTRKAKEWHIGVTTPKYGFRYNDARAGLLVYKPEPLSSSTLAGSKSANRTLGESGQLSSPLRRPGRLRRPAPWRGS